MKKQYGYLVSYSALNGRVLGHMEIFRSHPWVGGETNKVVEFIAAEKGFLGDLVITSVFRLDD